MRALLALALALVFGAPGARSVAPAVDEPDPAACAAWGFKSPSCSDCASLASFVQKEEELVEQCKRCCVRDTAQTTYTSATLVVCNARIGMWPEVKNFVDKKASAFKGLLKVSYVFNSPPTLKLKHEGGSETLRVDNWKTSQFEEFLRERVKPASAAKA